MLVVYSYYVLDLVHRGHLKMMMNAKAVVKKDGVSVVGILTDEAVLERKEKKPVLSFDERMSLAHAIKYVDFAVAQETYSPLPNIKRIRPDIVLESTSHESKDIEEVRMYMDSIGGRLLVIPYYPGQSSSSIKNKVITNAGKAL